MPVRSLLSRGALVAAALLSASVAGAQTTVFTTDFETGAKGAQWSGAGTVQGAGTMPGFGAWMLRNEGQSATTLTLGGLAAHSSMTLTFDLGIWDSVDWGDTFVVSADGVELFNGPFGNYSTPSGGCQGPGTLLTGGVDRGYGFWVDCARNVSFTFGHSASTVTFAFAYPNSQGGADEFFSLDNVTVQTNARVDGSVVPEPGTWALLGTGLAGLALVARRRARA